MSDAPDSGDRPGTALRTRWDAERRVQEHLDARRDPYGDAELTAWLEAHPEELEAFVELIAAGFALGALAPVSPRAAVEESAAAPRSRRAWHPLPWVAAAAALLLLLLWPETEETGAGAPPDLKVDGGAATAQAPPSVLRAEVYTMRWTPDEIERTHASTAEATPLRRIEVGAAPLAASRSTEAAATAPRGVLRAAVLTSLND